jgi:hypothetical protein
MIFGSIAITTNLTITKNITVSTPSQLGAATDTNTKPIILTT